MRADESIQREVQSAESPSRPIKVIRVIGRLNVGGPAIQAILLTDGLNSGSFKSILVTGIAGSFEGDMRHLVDERKVRPVVIPELGREISWRGDLVALWKLYCLFRRERPDIVHTHTSKAGTLGRLAAFCARVPVTIHTFHGHVFHDYFSPVKTRVFIAIERLLALLTTRIIAISETLRDDLSSRYGVASKDKFEVISLGLDLAPMLKISARECGEEDREVVIGFVGRLVPIKNPAMMIRVFARMLALREGFRLRLVIAGDGELRSALEAQAAEAEIRDRIEFVGWQHDMSKMYEQCDILALTSLNEGTPVALIEAMAAGLPFVSTNVGGVPDLMVGEPSKMPTVSSHPGAVAYGNGILVESGDDNAMAAALSTLIAEPRRRVLMGSEGRNLVASRYSFDRLMADIKGLYISSLEGRCKQKANGISRLWGNRRAMVSRKVSA